MSSQPSSATALIVVDVQRAFDQWEAAGKRRNNPDAVGRIVELLAAFRASATPIFHIRHEGTRPKSSFLPDGTGYRVKDEAREIAGEPVIVTVDCEATIVPGDAFDPLPRFVRRSCVGLTTLATIKFRPESLRVA